MVTPMLLPESVMQVQFLEVLHVVLLQDVFKGLFSSGGCSGCRLTSVRELLVNDHDDDGLQGLVVRQWHSCCEMVMPKSQCTQRSATHRC